MKKDLLFKWLYPIHHKIDIYIIYVCMCVCMYVVCKLLAEFLYIGIWMCTCFLTPKASTAGISALCRAGFHFAQAVNQLLMCLHKVFIQCKRRIRTHRWHLFGGISWWFSPCRTMRRFHYNFKLSAVHTLPKLPTIANFSQDLYCLSEIQFLDPSDQLWLSLRHTMGPWVRVVICSLVNLFKLALEWFFMLTYLRPSSVMCKWQQLSGGALARLTLSQHGGCHSTAGWGTTQAFWHKFTSICFIGEPVIMTEAKAASLSTPKFFY